MEVTDTSDALQKLEAAQQTPIADLGPELSDPTARAVGGVVTITWPYNSVKNTFAFILAEPDFRLRRNKGQVRINFTGASAKAAGESGLGGNDEVLMSLEGADWEPEAPKKRQSLSGAGIDWQLKFAGKVLLRVTSGETGDTKVVTIQEAPTQGLTEPVENEVPPAEISPIEEPPPQSLPALTPTKNTRVTSLNDGEYESPAFVKRARMSYGSLFENGYDMFEDDGGVFGRGRKRTKFGRDSSAWRYSSLSATPEPPASSHSDVAGQDEEQITSPPRPEMTDEGCQTMELDIPLLEPVPADTARDGAERIQEVLSDTNAVPHSGGSMIDHNAQVYAGDGWPNARNGWPPAPSSSLPPFGSPNVNVHAEANPFQSNMQPEFGSSGFQQGWEPKLVPYPPDPGSQAPFTRSQPTEPLPSNGFPNPLSTDQAVEFGHPHAIDRAHSPSSPPDFATEQVEPDNHQNLVDNEQDQLIHTQPSVAYPPLDGVDEVEARPAHDNALHDYPVVYLDNRQQFQREDETAGQRPFDEEVPVAANMELSSWATVNHKSQATAMPQTDRLGSTDGETPDQALVIDESESDEEPAPVPIAVEDTAVNGRADALGTYEDADAGDVDAQYSDDDEPEYDADEMGGDYDTRNYIGPDDDEDDSRDEDLHLHQQEPEFEDGESWDDEDEDEYPDEYESEYEMDDEQPQRPLQPATQSDPMVIDLISSSEDEDEDEDDDGDDTAPPEQSAQSPPSGLAHVQPQTTADDPRNPSPEYGPPNPEDDHESERLSVTSEVRDPEGDEAAEDDSRQEQASDPSGDEEGDDEFSDEFSDDASSQHELEEISDVDEQPPPKPDLAEDIITQIVDEDELMQDGGPTEDAVAAPPMSAADGLEMLSRVVDNESNSRRTETLGEVVDQIVADRILSDHTTEVPRCVYVEDESQDASEVSEQVDMVPTSSRAGTESQPILAEETLQNDAVAPSSPPSTQSFQSRTADDAVETTVQETTVQETLITVESAIPADQLPTPLDTQQTDVTVSRDSATAVPMEADESPEPGGPTETAETKLEEIKEVTVIPAQSVDPEQPISVTETTAERMEEQDEPTPSQPPLQPAGIDAEQAPQPATSSVPSPAPSFQTQVDADDMARAEPLDQTPQLTAELGIEDADVGVSSVSWSFRSQMELDEELQASILEYSQDLDEEPEQLFQADVMSEVQTQDQAEDDVDDASSSSEPTEEAHDLNMEEFEVQEEAPSSPVLGATPAKEPAVMTPAQDQENFSTRASSPDEFADASSQMDPSVQLARAANAARQVTRQRESTPEVTRPHTRSLGTQSSPMPGEEDSSVQPARASLQKPSKADPSKAEFDRSSTTTETSRPITRSFDTHRSPSPEEEDSSVQLARASLSKQPKGEPPKPEEDSSSMTAAKLRLVRHLRDELHDCTSLKVLRQHLTKTLDVIALAVMEPPEPRRAKGGPREYIMSFTITDHSIGPHGVAKVLLYRQHKETLPIVKSGDVVLLRNFQVTSLPKNGYGLKSTDGSSWAVFDAEDQPAQIKGPPVEYGEAETDYVAYMREWFGLLDDKARERLKRANQKTVDVGRGGK